MKYTIQYSNQFEKSLKKCFKRGLDIEKLRDVIRILENTGSLPPKYKPHKLSGNYSGCWECHIQNDWLLIWKQDDKVLTLLFLNTGSHSDIFG